MASNPTEESTIICTQKTKDGYLGCKKWPKRHSSEESREPTSHQTGAGPTLSTTGEYNKHAIKALRCYYCPAKLASQERMCAVLGLSAPQRVPGEMRGSLLSDMIIRHLLKQLGCQAAEFKALTGVSTSRAREVTRKGSRAEKPVI